MGFPSFIKKTPGTTFPWEKNEWYRKHGYNLPFDTYLILQWTCLFILDITFFCFLTHFLTVYDNVETPVLLDFENLQLTLLQIEKKAYINPYTTWSCLLMAIFTTLVKLLSVTTSMIDTEDPEVAEKRGQTSRSPTYIRRYGAPVIDSYSGISILNLTTIQYLNLPVRNSEHSIFDSDDSDDDFYYSDSEDSDINQSTVRKRSLRVHPRWFGYPLYRKMALKTRRTWISLMRVFFPNYKYRPLNATKNNGCCIPGGRGHVLPTRSRRKHAKRDDRFRTRDDVNMEEFLATRTLRPVMTADGEDEPDYDDDMGLDFTGLDVDDVEDDVVGAKKVETKPRISKAARLLDLPEEEALIQMQQQQRLGTIELKEESALYKL
ncbi:hypothetical protein HPULCUR_007701 [Helicostylum pulchrum]|uniref:Uncharacterized protein n=1 Tax=Helicostylum pulchrum TaxID=562976 RepID=A0ABP9Y6L0_9FUNG